MKPQRIAMTHQLVLGYGLHKHLDVYVRPSSAWHEPARQLDAACSSPKAA